MSKKGTILVSGATGVVGYGCLRSLKVGGRFKLIGTSIHENLIATAFCDEFEKAIHTDDSHYMDWLSEIIKKHKVDLLIPGIEIDMFKWNENRDLILSTGAKSMLNNYELISLCGDKWHFYNKLNKTFSGLAILSSMERNYNELVLLLGSPFLLKPRRGFASKGIVKVYNQEEFHYYSNKLKQTFMAQKIVRGDEYTIGAFYDKYSNLCAYICMKRRLSTSGFTESAEVCEIKEMKDILVELGKIFMPVGPTNLQFIECSGSLKLLEINPRISSATSLRTAFNYNECCMGADLFLKNSAPLQPHILFGRADRYTEEIIEYDRNYIGCPW